MDGNKKTDELTLQRQRQAAPVNQMQTGTKNEMQGTIQLINQEQSQMEQSANMQMNQKDTSILDWIHTIPAECCCLEQDLQKKLEDTCKLGRRFVEVRQKKERMKIKQKRKEYDNFFEPVDSYVDALTDALGQEKVYDADTISKHLSASIGSAGILKLIPGEHHADAKVDGLGRLLEQLQATDANAVTTEQLEQMKTAYLKSGFKDTDIVGMSYFDTEDTKGAYVILLYNVAAQLFELVNRMPREMVDIAAVAKLYGIANAAALAAGTMCMSAEFRQQHTTLVDNLAYIRRGTDAYGKTPGQWQMAEYAGAVERVMGEEELKTRSLKEVSERVERMRQCIESNMIMIPRVAAGAGGIYELPVVQEALQAKIIEQIGDRLLTEQYTEEKLAELAAEAGGELAQKNGVYQEYADYLKTDELFRLVPDAYRNKQLQQYMTGDSLEQFKATIAPFREQIQANLELVREQMNQTLAEPLQEAALALFVEKNSDVLLDGSVREVNRKIDWYLTYITTYAPTLFGEVKGVDADHYFKKPRQLQERKQVYLFAEQLKGDAFCHWKGFDGMLEGYETEVMKQLDEALKNRSFGEVYLHDVHCVNDLDQLQYWQFARFLSMLRGNIGKVLDDWSGLSGPMEKKIRIEMLSGMLCGTIDKKDFLHAVNTALETCEKEQELQQQRRLVLLSGEQKTHGEIICRYLDVMQNTAANQEPRNMPRTRRFEHAVKVRGMLRSLGAEENFEKKVRGLIADDRFENEEIMKAAMAAINELDQPDRKVKRAWMKDIKTLSEADNGFGLELAVSGYEDLLLKKKDVREAFAAYDRTRYEEILAKEAAQCVLRKARLRDEQITDEGMIDNIRAALVGLEEVKDREADSSKESDLAKYNVEHFGVGNFDELCDLLKEYKADKDGIQQKVRQAGERYQKRLDRLCGLRGGLYRFLRNQFVEDLNVLSALMMLPDAAYEDYLGTMDARLWEPVKLLSRRYGMESGFTKQVFLEYGSKMVGADGYRDNWDDIFSKYYSRISDYMIGEHSISQTFKEIVSGQPDIAPYLISILIEQKEGCMLLANRQELSRTIDNYRVRIRANEAALAREMSRNREWTSGHEDDIRRFLLKNIAMVEESDFAAQLPGYLESYQEQSRLVQEDTKRAEKVMEERRSMMLQVETRKQMGRQADFDSRYYIQLGKHVRETLTPVIAANCEDWDELYQMPDMKQIGEARQSVKRALEQPDVPQYPAFVTDTLTEYALMHDKLEGGDRLREEAALIADIYQKAGLEEIEEKYKRLMPDMQEALATYVYCRSRWNVWDGVRAFKGVCQMLADIHDMPVTGAVASKEKSELFQTVQTGCYWMGESTLKDFAKSRMKYIEQLNQVEPLCERAVEKYGGLPAEKQALKLGLLTYYRKELTDRHYLKEKGLEAVEAEVEQLLSDAQMRSYLAQTTEQVMASTGSDALTQEEQQTDTFMDRERFEQEIETLMNQKERTAYNGLSRQQRKVFALALCVSGTQTAVSGLGGYRLFHEQEDEAAELAAIQIQIQRYVCYDEFAPDIDYAKAFEHLQMGCRKLNTEAFEHALLFTQMVENNRKQQYTPDYSRLGDAEASVKAANLVADAGSQAAKQKLSGEIPTTDAFFDDLEKQLRACGAEMDDLVKSVQKIRENQTSAARLIQILQDRTVVDLSTAVKYTGRALGKKISYVNEGKRLAMLEQAEKGNDIAEDACSSEHLQKAMNTLLSYQLRNDIDLSGHEPSAGDFAEKALKRPVPIDTLMLCRAIDLVDEMNLAQLRMDRIRMAPKLIRKTLNFQAMEAYDEHQAGNVTFQTQEEFENFLEKQAKQENQLGILAGYRLLSQEDRTLFIKALGSRWVLDVSKRHIMANRFGMIERDYADPVGRDALCDEYFMNARSTKRGVDLGASAYEDAYLGMLSAQVNDAIDYTQFDMKWLDKVSFDREDVFSSGRKEVVDWKLVKRALQLVHRCVNESEIYAGDRELYVSQGDLSKTGQFGFESAYMRRNLHSAGNRLTRHLGRRVADNVSDKLPGPLMVLVGNTLPVTVNNALSQYALFEQKEKKEGFIEQAADLAGTAGDLTEHKVGELLSDFSDAVGYITDVKDLAKAVQNNQKLKHATAQAAEAAAGDEQRMEQAVVHQSEAQAALGRDAKERNAQLQEAATTKARERQTDQIIDSVSSIVGRALGSVDETDGDVIEAAVTEAGKFINLVRNYRNDKESVKAYFEKRGEIARVQDEMKRLQSEKECSKTDPLELLCQARGYENITELASFVGLNVTRSLLFCASAFNRQMSLRIKAVATLGVLGMEDVIGKWDSGSAERVYAAIMGSEYR